MIQMGIRKGVGERLAGRESGGAHVGAAGDGRGVLGRTRAWATDKLKVCEN